MATLATNIVFQYNKPDGKPLAGGKVYTYEAHTTTPKATYTDAQESAINTNPVILDEAGQANMYFGDGAYRVIIHDADGVLMSDIPSISRYVTFSELEAFQNEVGLSISKLDVVQEQVNTYVNNALVSQKGAAGGIAPLNELGKIALEYLPDLIPLLFSPIRYPKATPPDGFLLMDGRAITQAQYPILFSLYGSSLPDMRGVFIRGWDNGRGLDPGRSLLSYQNDDLKRHGHVTDLAHGSGNGSSTVNALRTLAFETGLSGYPTSDVGGAETRPKNISFNYIVKAG